MRRRWLVLVILGGCSSSNEAETDARETIRGERICELNELYVLDEALNMRVYNNVGLHDCPDAWLEQIDSQRYAVGGPRWRSADLVATLGAPAPGAAPEEVPEGLGYDMLEAANVTLFELSVMEAKLGTTITVIDDLPTLVRDTILEATLRSTEYVITEVRRSFSTEFVHFAGQEVFVLNDGSCDYAMKYYTSVFDPDLVNEAAVATLGDRFEHLPAGFSFSVQTFDDDLVITEDEGIQYVLTDEFGNSYDRFRCD